MRVLILGGSGMLGHRLWLDLAETHQVYATVRDPDLITSLPELQQEMAIHKVDARRIESVQRAIQESKPDVVINAIGLIKQVYTPERQLEFIWVNALFPHQLAKLHSKVVHVSTDCVFSGALGRYVERSLPDAKDFYGRTKALGEVESIVTLRTSIIGHELRGFYGLLEWFLRQTGTVYGYRRAIFSGLTTNELARVIDRHVLPNLEALVGVHQVASNPISKYDLLDLIRRDYALRLNLIPQDETVVDRSLDGRQFKSLTGYQAPSWPVLVRAMRMEVKGGAYRKVHDAALGAETVG